MTVEFTYKNEKGELVVDSFTSVKFIRKEDSDGKFHVHFLHGKISRTLFCDFEIINIRITEL